MNLQTNVASAAAPGSAKIDLEAMIRTKLPPLPGSVIRILQLLQDVNVTTRSLATAVGYDPSLTTRILRLANSPIYYQQREITSIQQAIDTIGLRSLYDILMLGIAANAFSREIQHTVIGRVVWEHSLTVALFARELSRMMGMRAFEEVFICGLLHDIGKIMLLRADPENYSSVLEKKSESEMLRWEFETFGYDHSQVGAIVARGWKLPEEVCQVILDHHKAAQSDQSVMVLHLINIADIVANYNGYGLRLEDAETLENSESMMFLNLRQEQLEKAWEKIESSLDEVINVFD